MLTWQAAKAYETSISLMDEPRNKAGGAQYWVSSPSAMCAACAIPHAWRHSRGEDD